jgi:hypothetical protein
MWWESGGLGGGGHVVDIGRWFALHSSSAGSEGWMEGRGSGNRNPVQGENTMPKAKGRKAAAKHLHKGKKLEATKPLKGVKGGGQYLKFDLKDVTVSSVQN